MQEHWKTEVKRELRVRKQLQDEVRDNPDDVGTKYRLAFARPDGVAWDKKQLSIICTVSTRPRRRSGS
ncbi:hypothetical protein ACFOJF_15395 [Pseudocitrobacter faecalis]